MTQDILLHALYVATLLLAYEVVRAIATASAGRRGEQATIIRPAIGDRITILGSVRESVGAPFVLGVSGDFVIADISQTAVGEWWVSVAGERARVVLPQDMTPTDVECDEILPPGPALPSNVGFVTPDTPEEPTAPDPTYARVGKWWVPLKGTPEYHAQRDWGSEPKPEPPADTIEALDYARKHLNGGSVVLLVGRNRTTFGQLTVVSGTSDRLQLMTREPVATIEIRAPGVGDGAGRARPTQEAP